MSAADWAVQRIKIFERDNGTCHVCGKEMWSVTQADIHHVNKRSLGRDDRASNLVTLCRDCHFNHHQQNP